MKHHFLLAFFLLTALATQAQTVTIQKESFEVALGVTGSNVDVANTTVLTVAASGSNEAYFLRTSNATIATDAPGFSSASTTVNPIVLPSGGTLDGTYYWVGEGVKGTVGSVSQATRSAGNLTLKSVSIAGYASLKVTIGVLLGRATRTSDRMETDDTLKVQVRFNGSGSWTTIGQIMGDNTTSPSGYWRMDANLNNSSADDALLSPPSPSVGNPMSDFTFEVPGSGSTLQTRIVAAQQGTAEEFAFDNIRVTGIASANQAPVLASLESTPIAYNEGAPPTQLTGTLTVSDADNATLASATVKFTGAFDNTEDRLLFTNQNNITGSYNTGTGTLSLTGTASVAAYQAALRSVQYQDIDAIDATPGTRTVAFSVNDGLSSSLTLTRNLTVTAYLVTTTLPYTEDLETDGEGTRYSSTHYLGNNGSGFGRTNVATEPNGQWHSNGATATTLSGYTNAYYWWGSGPTNSGRGNFYSRPITTAGYASLIFSVKLASSVGVWEYADYVRIHYRINGGGWVPMLLFRSTDQTTTSGPGTGNLRQDTNPGTTPNVSGSVPTGSLALGHAMTTVSYALPAAANGQTIEIWIEEVGNNSDGEGEVVGFDLLQLTGTANNPPLIANQTRSIGENSANGTAVGAVIAASDPDAGQTLSYSLVGGNMANTFAINATTGQLTVANSAALNYEVTPTYALVVQVSDTGTPPRSATATVTITVTNVNELVATITSQTNVACNGGATGGATVTASGENAPFSYAWRNLTTNTTLAQNSPSLTGLSAGTYSVTITATSSGFTATTSLTISQPTALSLTSAHTNVSTLGASTGTASVAVSGGTPAYSYDWSPGSPTGDSSSSISSLSAGTYSVQVTDANGCQITQSVSVTTDPDLTPLLYARPSTLYGNASFSVVVDVQELNGVASSGPVTVRLSKDAQTSLIFEPGLSSVGGRSVQNGSWRFSSDDSYYIFTSSQAISGGGTLSLGLRGELTAKATSGMFTLSVSEGGGGESKLSNNSDAEKVEYFQP